MNVDISIVSLKKDKERRNELLKQLYRFTDKNIKVIDAVYGKELPVSEYFKLFQCKGSRWTVRKILTPSELGCFLSHKKTLENFILNENDWLIVLEDDVIVTDKFESLLQLDLNNLDKRDIYILGGQDGLNCFKRVILKKNNNSEFKRAILGTHRWICRTCCYLLHRNSAKEILQLMNATTFAVDDWPYVIKNTKIRSLQYSNYIKHPIDLSNSSIESERLFLKR